MACLNRGVVLVSIHVYMYVCIYINIRNAVLKCLMSPGRPFPGFRYYHVWLMMIIIPKQVRTADAHSKHDQRRIGYYLHTHNLRKNKENISSSTHENVKGLFFFINLSSHKIYIYFLLKIILYT